ncbi:MAG: FmdB family transcriptional regulator [Candidatus Omnitrophica bacterium CG11_big_fil_rev_8_21_14_0_20_63_9]|nr:MAG: FmdB family transcriptional regulator [Candidatus Omnitrophica bacterium CG11_big_fil_rev_8_21_14_0_20_63_9]
MPTYEYQCQKCKKPHEALQSITAKPLTKCPKCGGRLKRLMGSGSGFIFKGSGFYITDYRKKSYHEAKKKDQPNSSGSSSSSTGSKT